MIGNSSPQAENFEDLGSFLCIQIALRNVFFVKELPKKDKNFPPAAGQSLKNHFNAPKFNFTARWEKQEKVQGMGWLETMFEGSTGNNLFVYNFECNRILYNLIATQLLSLPIL